MCCLFVTSCILMLYSVQVTLIGLAASLFWQGSCKYNYKFSFIFKCVCFYFCVFITFVSLFIAFIIIGLLMYYGRFLSEIKQLIDWLIEQCLMSLPTQYRLHGRRCVFCTIVINNINDNNHNNMTVCQRQTAQTDNRACVFSYPFLSVNFVSIRQTPSVGYHGGEHAIAGLCWYSRDWSRTQSIN